ncbi:MAG: C10 family peptidase [Bacteroidota bacterium]
MKKQSFRNLLVVICLIFTSNVFSAIISQQDAAKVAKNFYFEKINSFTQTTFDEIVFSNVITITSNDIPVYYVFERGDKGFIMISADDATQPVLGYSFNTPYSSQSHSPAFEDWVNGYQLQINNIREKNIQTSSDIQYVWNKYLTNNIPNLSNKTGEKVVAPLLTSTWNQGKYYNTLCPRDTGGEDGHLYVGCVATSMSQIMNYYRYPSQGTGSHSYTASSYGLQSANFATTTYDFNSMTDNATSYNNALATLCYQCGVAVNMDYAPGGSGAQTQDAATALKTYFKYSSTITVKNKNQTSNWTTTLTANLDLFRPILYSGSSQASGGHAWVCDGYQGTDYFHFNWGWGGAGDGYYYTTALNPLGEDFNSSQTAILNIFPASSYPTNCTGTTTLSARSGSFEDGSGNASYQNNLNCSWLIAPPSATNITLSFSRFSTEATNDVVNVYNGSTTSSPLLGSYSGSSIPISITSTSGTMLVTFTTNGSAVADGWLANYTSNVGSAYCNSVKLLTTPSGTLTDGSGTNDYYNNTYCKWIIQPAGATFVTLQFTSFNIENSADAVEVYNSGTNPITLLGTYSGATLPPTITSPSGKMQVIFYSDNRNPGAGWDATYNTVSGIENMNFLNSFSLFPNPASDKLNIELNLQQQQDIQIQVLNLNGSSVLVHSLAKQSGIVSTSLNIAGLAKGIYVVKILGETGSLTRKLVIK